MKLHDALGFKHLDRFLICVGTMKDRNLRHKGQHMRERSHAQNRAYIAEIH